MSAQSIIPYLVREVLRQLGDTFRTKELSRHPTMLQGHAGLTSHSHYHAFVGKYLSEHCDDVERIGDSSTDEGALWRNKLSSEGASIQAGNISDHASSGARSAMPER